MSGKKSEPGTFWGKKISEIDIWRKPGTKRRDEYSYMRLSSHPDPTANTAIANVMREEQMRRKRKLMQLIEEDRERKRILNEKIRDEKKRQKEAEQVAAGTDSPAEQEMPDA